MCVYLQFYGCYVCTTYYIRVCVHTYIHMYIHMYIVFQVLAQGIYDELQGMMDEFGQEPIANLMPLVVNILENLDSALSDNQVTLHSVSVESVCVLEDVSSVYNPYDISRKFHVHGLHTLCLVLLYICTSTLIALKLLCMLH